MAFLVGAYPLDETSSETQNVRMMIVVAFLFGFRTFANNVFQK